MRGARYVRHAATSVKKSTRFAMESVHVQRKGEQRVPLPHENFRYRHVLMPSYLDYVSRVSWADHAVSLETAAVLLQVCETRHPRRLLDTGSGYSSYVLRRYANDVGAEVVSVDDDEAWMQKTADYLDAMKVGTAGLTSWDSFAEADHQPFDLIFHDMGTHATRVLSMPFISTLITGSGDLIYDDMQVETVRAKAIQVTATADRHYLSMARITTDAIGRYASLSIG